MKNPTIKDVARKAKVSIATVSLVLNNNSRISAETKTKVLDTVKKLNYHPSRSARGLVSKKTGNVGFILTNDHFLRTEPFYTHIFMGTEFGARDNELYVLLTTVDSNFLENDSLPRFILDRSVDGIIVAGKIPPILLEKLSHYKLPIVFIDYIPDNNNYPNVLVDNICGGKLATKHLIDLGHKDIAFIGGDIDHPSIRDRFNGYTSALKEANIKVNKKLIEIKENYPGRINGYNAGKRLLQKGEKITAIFTCNDAMAIGLIQYIKDSGLKVPDDISIVGFDDVVSESSFEPELSTIRIPKMEMGIKAIQLMSSILKGKNNGNKNISVPVELIIRKSTKQINNN